MKQFLLEIAQDKRRDALAVWLSPFLYFLSLLYGMIVRLVCWAYRLGILPEYQSKIKIISVGNITLGGTGKTPFVKYLAKVLLEEGRKAVILSRGYGMDEPALLEANLTGIKVITGRDRIKKVKEIEKDCPCEVILLDDGFQHWRLKRDLDIVLLNSREYLGNRNLIPRGLLREPASSLRRAEIIVLSKADTADKLSLIKEELRRINPSALVVESAHQPRGISLINGKELGLSALEGKNVCLLSGIADPDSFARTAGELGAGLSLDLRYPDHYGYKDKDIRDIINKCRGARLDTVVTTEKDLPRLSAWIAAVREAGLKVLVLKIGLKITENERLFFERIRRVLDS